MDTFESVKAVVVGQLNVDAEKIKTVNDVVTYIERATK